MDESEVKKIKEVTKGDLVASFVLLRGSDRSVVHKLLNVISKDAAVIFTNAAKYEYNKDNP